MNCAAHHPKTPSFLTYDQNQRQPSPARSTMAGPAAVALAVLAAVLVAVDAGDENRVFQPCADAKVQRYDGFTFGIAFASRDSFFFNRTQLSPCDQRLSLSSNNAQLAVFRPKVDEISLLTINTTTTPSEQPLQINTVITHEDQLPQEFHIVGLLSVYKDMVTSGGFMVAFAGRKYAARSFPTFVGNSSYSVTSFTLVLEFQKGTLQNLYWKQNGCSSCSGNSNFVCLNKQECAIKTSSCKGLGQGGSVDCSIGIQTAFSGTDKHEVALNSWYEVSNLRQYSLYGLYSNLKGSLTSQFDNFF